MMLPQVRMNLSNPKCKWTLNPFQIVLNSIKDVVILLFPKHPDKKKFINLENYCEIVLKNCIYTHILYINHTKQNYMSTSDKHYKAANKREA